jgi:uncharacterized protein (DUF1778 family)
MTSLNLELSPELNEEVEHAASLLGQSAREFAASAVVRNAREVIKEHQVTRLSERDWRRFAAALDDADAKPNERLRKAAEEYKKYFG